MSESIFGLGNCDINIATIDRISVKCYYCGNIAPFSNAYKVIPTCDNHTPMIISNYSPQEQDPVWVVSIASNDRRDFSIKLFEKENDALEYFKGLKKEYEADAEETVSDRDWREYYISYLNMYIRMEKYKIE